METNLGAPSGCCACDSHRRPCNAHWTVPLPFPRCQLWCTGISPFRLPRATQSKATSRTVKKSLCRAARYHLFHGRRGEVYGQACRTSAASLSRLHFSCVLVALPSSLGNPLPEVPKLSSHAWPVSCPCLTQSCAGSSVARLHTDPLGHAGPRKYGHGVLSSTSSVRDFASVCRTGLLGSTSAFLGTPFRDIDTLLVEKTVLVQLSRRRFSNGPVYR